MPVILVIFGITGDLAKKKLLPAIAALKEAGKLPVQFTLVGVSRQAGPDYFQMDLHNPAEYVRLAEHLATVEEKFDAPAQRLYYLAVPPASSGAIVAHLGAAGLLDEPTDKPGRKSDFLPGKLLLEKPFGTDLASSEVAITHIAKYAKEEQVYRVDHYLAKALAGRILAARKERAWSAETIERIDIVMTEAIGIEGRKIFYEHVGVLGDVIQSHGMELLALMLMELPEDSEEEPLLRRGFAGQALARAAALAHLVPVRPESAVRGQYAGYREEVENAASVMPTYASLILHSQDPVWAGAKFTITAGKALSEKRTEVRITFKDGERRILDAEPEDVLGGYAQVLSSAIAGEHERFTSSSEVLASWLALDALVQAWRMNGEGLFTYERGSSALQLHPGIDEVLPA